MFTDNSKSLTKENILKQIDSYQLFKAYCANFKEIDVKFRSEFRKDPNPSAVITIFKGELFYRDFGEKGGLRVFDFIARKFSLDYNRTLQKINTDFGLQLGYNSTGTTTPLVIPEKYSTDYTQIEKKGTIIEINPRPWTALDKKYWDRYHIPLKLLEYHNIKSISHYRITNTWKENAMYAVNPYMLGFSIDYYWNNGIFRRKLYFPQSKNGRFISNVDSTIVQGWTLLPKGGDILFITKSYKDILIFNLLGYWAIAPNNEHAYIPFEVMEKLKKRWKHIFVWFDNDEGGITGASSFSEKFDLKWTHNPIGTPKDPSDYVEKFDLKSFDKLINDFLQYVYTK